MPMSDSANKNAEVREQQVQGSLGYIESLSQAKSDFNSMETDSNYHPCVKILAALRASDQG